MSNSYITLANGTNRQTVERVVDGATVHACVDTLSDGINGSSIARVLGDNPLPTDPALVTRPINGSGTNALNIQDGGNSITVDGPLTDTQLRATAVPMSGTVTANAGTGTFAVGGTVTANIGTIGTIATEATLGAIAGQIPAALTTAGSLKVATVDPEITDTLTSLDDTVEIASPGGAATGSITITGTWVGTISFEGTVNGTTWLAVATPNGLSSTTSNSTFRIQLAGFKSFRAKMSAWSSGTATVTLLVSAAPMSVLLGASSSAIGKLSANDGVDVGDATINNAAGAAAVNIQDGGNSITVDGTVTITPPTLTKGTQGATGLSVQALKDAGRTTLTYLMTAPVTLTTTDTAQSLVGYSNGASIGAATATATSAIGAGKTWRLTGVSIEYSGSNTAGGALVTLRANTSGAAVVASPAIGAWLIGSGVGGFCSTPVQFADGIELPAGSSIVISAQGRGTNNAAAALGYVRVGVTSFVY